MVGGGSKREESVAINSSNIFAALGSLRKKKTKDQGSSKSGPAKKEPEKEFHWAPAPLAVRSWADVDDEDDDDYYATTAPLQSPWINSKAEKETEEPAVEESESEEEGLDDVDDDLEEEHEKESAALVEVGSVDKKPQEASLSHKDTERQLSKKELKKKGLEELDAVLAELGYTNKEAAAEDECGGVAQEQKGDKNEEMEKKKETAPGESKSAKKKKKKDKLPKEAKESQDQHVGADVRNGTEESAGTENMEDTSAVDVKERLKKMASAKKKKSSKEMDAAARAAATEAAARRAKLAAAKKKEKNHYNQQPVR
ncbi:hypothetical protein CFOL_v3_25522 [Cephalotus follicularis]|uniref:Uncharacterized protein n=1 Tax=Cephalotus follicularis TaxID=3775 RepID=A0A1Q3CP87_CEPFO|nr:hypothetical protein CFOL_v3_25522 [Cephalotus follicularis]